MTKKEKLTEALNAAAEKAGEPGGYVVENHTFEDNYRDRWGYKVEGPNTERALKWIATVTKGRTTYSNVPWYGTNPETGENGQYWVYTDYVETGSYYVGE